MCGPEADLGVPGSVTSAFTHYAISQKPKMLPRAFLQGVADLQCLPSFHLLWNRLSDVAEGKKGRWESGGRALGPEQS